MEALRIENLTKKIGKRTILGGINLTVNAGEIVGLVGENGAGKSSLLKCICGLWRANSGNIRIFGKSLTCNAYDDIGALIEYPSLFGGLTLEENIALFGAYCRNGYREIAKKLLALFGLEEFRHKKVKTFSSGMKQKSCLLIVLMKQPKFLVLDEPTATLDPRVSLEIRNLIEHYQHEFGATVLISSHNLTEIETLCGRVFMIRNGTISAEYDLTASPRRLYKMKFADTQKAFAARSVFSGYLVKQTAESLYCKMTGSELARLIKESDVDISDLTVCSLLEEKFISEEQP